MMIATNWGVYEIGKRQKEFIEPGDARELQVRARDAEHLAALRERIPGLGETVFLDGIADFPYRAYVARDVLGMGLWDIVFTEIDYIQFKKDAVNNKLHSLLSKMWSSWLDFYPQHSSYTQTKPSRQRESRPRAQGMTWWEDAEAANRRRNGLS